MAASFTVSTFRYTHTYGVPPHGFRLWYFLMPGGRTFRHRGDFSDAVRLAKAHAEHLALSRDAVLQVFA